MSEYKGIKGFQVQTRTEDPVPYAQALEDNPYAGSWGSGGALNTARDGMLGGAGTQTAGQVTGGRSSPGGNLAVNELYNGTAFTESADLNEARQFLTTFGATNTASITTGGTAPSASARTESWDGSSFTEVNNLNSARSNLNSAGTNTAGLVFGGSDTANRAYSESWDGTNWTEVNDLNTARGGLGGCGLQTAAVAFGGYSTTVVNNTETWNGSSWTEVNNLNTAREKPAGSGTQTAALSAGGDPPASALNESWDGTSWTEVADLSTARGASGTSHNSNTSTFVAGGRNASGNQVTTTEEWSFSGLDPSTTPAADYANAITGDFYYNSSTGQFKTINTGGAPIGAWASANAMPTALAHTGSAGTPSSAFAAGGYNPGLSPSYRTANQLWNGTSWSDGNTIGTGRSYLAGAGTAASGLAFGGSDGSNAQSVTEEFDGSSWTESGDLNNARAELGGAGTQTAALAFGGTPSPTVKEKTESYNGSTWTALNDMNRGGGAVTGWGTTGAAICQIGTGVSPYVGTESWDGTSWTNGPNTNHANFYRDSAGAVSTDGLIWGGYEPPGDTGTANTESWNGTAFTEVADLATKRYDNTDIGSGSLGALAGGGVNGGTYITTTEEWTAADFQIKTVTTS